MKITEKELIEKSKIDGYYVLSSNLISNKYYNLKDLYCRNHDLVLNYFEERIKSINFDTIVSIELGGALIASGLAERLNKPLAIYRKNEPSIGQPIGKCLIIDDVSTTGNSINKLIKWIKDCNAEIFDIIIGIDRRKLK